MSTKKNHSNYSQWSGIHYRFDIFESDRVPENKPITQVYGLILNNSRDSILCVYNKNGMWILPGGGVEEGEVLVETLIRETKEETNRTLKFDSIKPVFYQDVFFKRNEKWLYETIQMRYMAIVDLDLPFENDPDGDVIEARWIRIEDLDNFIDWGKTTKFIKNLLKDTNE